ncbi:MAG TPA: ferredoxin [Candidatus Pacearchaeota archaeon]|nr:ferredoxin [archaeon BMS3Abin17]HDK42415.1 ferredoxin [Candidatus Pacearchaeota archaeon]HDZ60787.1 ferredoxin [Candidatus Pacearchaeota archaeon]
MVIKIDKEKCIGCGLCSSICGEIFEMSDDSKAKVKKQKDSPCLKEAIDSCPVEAISG